MAEQGETEQGVKGGEGAQSAAAPAPAPASDGMRLHHGVMIAVELALAGYLAWSAYTHLRELMSDG